MEELQLTRPEKLRAVAATLDLYDQFLRALQTEHPEWNWDIFPFQFDGTEADDEMQRDLREFADELDANGGN